MNYEPLRVALQFAQIVLTIALGIFVYYGNKRAASKESVEKKLNDHETRIVKVESACNQAPNHADLAGLHEKINGMGKDVSGMAGELKALVRGVGMIQEYLMRKGDE